MAIVVGRTVGPPGRPAFTELDLRSFDLIVRLAHSFRISQPPRSSHRAPGVHELGNKRLPALVGERRIAHPPKPATNHEIPPIRRSRVGGSLHGLVTFTVASVALAGLSGVLRRSPVVRRQRTVFIDFAFELALVVAADVALVAGVGFDLFASGHDVISFAVENPGSAAKFRRRRIQRLAHHPGSTMLGIESRIQREGDVVI